MKHKNSFGVLSHHKIQGQSWQIMDLRLLPQPNRVQRLPMSLRVLLENALRHEDGKHVTRQDIEAILSHGTERPMEQDIAFTPARVLLQDFTGVPAVVDLAAMRDAMVALGGDPERINPRVPAELVIDHSVQVDQAGHREAMHANAELELQRNKERFAFLKWGQSAFQNFSVVPPGRGIVHQVNLEYLARVVFQADGWLYPDTLVGTDSHTTMINGLGVLGWGCGGIEAEAALLGQPVSMRIPEVVGVELTGRLPAGATATDLVLTITHILRKRGVVGKFVEFFGSGAASLSLANRATIANMAPEYGATCGYFPVDAETLQYLRLTGRSDEHIQVIQSYLECQGLWGIPTEPLAYRDVVHVPLGSVEPCLAGPKRPQDRIPLREIPVQFKRHLQEMASHQTSAAVDRLGHGSVVLAAITSCTNTSNPAVLITAGLLAQKAVALGLRVPDWVKTSFAPGSLAVEQYLKRAGLMEPLEALGFHVVGHGCTTCIGNSGPLPEDVSKSVQANQWVVCSVLSGNRNFEGRIHPEVRMNYLGSPPLVVAYALAGHMAMDWEQDPVGQDPQGQPVYLRDLWPDPAQVQAVQSQALDSEMFRTSYQGVLEGDARWQALPVPAGSLYTWSAASTYVKHPPYFEGMSLDVPGIQAIRGARVLAYLGDSVTTDHISPAGAIHPESAAADHLREQGVALKDFNTYGARRGNHDIMVRGTWANIRLRNRLAHPQEGGWTRHMPSGEVMRIFDAAELYRRDQVPLIVLAGKEYGSGSSRDWAAKGPKLLGVVAVLAESFERIHRSNLVGMGVLPLRFLDGDTADSLGLTGHETFQIMGLEADHHAKHVTVRAEGEQGSVVFKMQVCLDTPQEVLYMEHGGILPYVLRCAVASSA